MEPNTKGLLPDSFKPLQNKALIVFNALFDNNAKWLYPKNPKVSTRTVTGCRERIRVLCVDGMI
jgi:hypothetical protein